MTHASATGSGVVLGLIRSGAATTRRDLLDALGWSRVTLERRLEELLSAGLIVHAGSRASGGGRPREEFAVESDFDKQKALADRMQDLTHDLVSFVPLGQSFPSQGIAANLEGFLESPVPFFWNVHRVQ